MAADATTHEHTSGVHANWLRGRIALAAATDFAALASTIVETWAPDIDAELRCYELREDAKGNTKQVDLGAPDAQVYRDATRRDLSFESTAFGRMHILRYDEERPGTRQPEAFHRPACVVVNVMHHMDGASAEVFRRSLHALRSLVTALQSRFVIEDALVWRQDEINLCPALPLLPNDALIMTVNPITVQEQFANADRYWQAWETRQVLKSDTMLVSRCTDLVYSVDYQRRIFEHHWQLAREYRGRKPARFGSLVHALSTAEHHLEPGHRALLDQESTLSGFHYHAGQAVLDVTAWTDPGTDVTPHDVARLLAWSLNGRFDGGEEVKEIRVTFPNREQASAQARVLLDIGCRVFHYGATPQEMIEVTA